MRAPIDSASLEAALTGKFGAAKTRADNGSLWSTMPSEGESQLIYRPYVSGVTVPIWVGRGGYRYGPDAAEVKDALIFYPPETSP